MSEQTPSFWVIERDGSKVLLCQDNEVCIELTRDDVMLLRAKAELCEQIIHDIMLFGGAFPPQLIAWFPTEHAQRMNAILAYIRKWNALNNERSEQ